MSVQTIQDIKPSQYHVGRFTIALSCGCEYPCSVVAMIGGTSECPRCPETIPAANGLGVHRWPRITHVAPKGIEA